MSQVLKIGFLFSLVGLITVIYYNIQKEQEFQNRLFAYVEKGMPFWEAYNEGMYQSVIEGTNVFANYGDIKKRAIALRKNRQQILTTDSIPNPKILLKNSLFKAERVHKVYHAFDSIDLEQLTKSLRQSTIKTLLLANERDTLAKFYVDIWGSYCGAYDSEQIITTTPTQVFKNTKQQGKIKLVGIPNFEQDRYQLYINEKRVNATDDQFVYRVKPTEIGQQNFFLSVKNQSNEVVLKDTIEYIVSDCKIKNYE